MTVAEKTIEQMVEDAYAAGYREGYDNALGEAHFDRARIMEARIIEECARVAESDDFSDYLHAGPAIAAAIRALKDK